MSGLKSVRRNYVRLKSVRLKRCLSRKCRGTFWNFELFPVDWIAGFEVDFVLEILGESQIVFIYAESVLVFCTRCPDIVHGTPLELGGGTSV
jgi:hypothetical protein